MGSKFSYFNYAMKIKSKNLQTFTIMKKLFTYLPSLYHPKKCKIPKKNWTDICCE